MILESKLFPVFAGAANCAIELILTRLVYPISDAQKFQCPNDKNGVYEDEVQCDKYFECRDGIAKERLCPDGLVFDPTLRKVNKCDQPFNVDCGDRTELRKSSRTIERSN